MSAFRQILGSRRLGIAITATAVAIAVIELTPTNRFSAGLFFAVIAIWAGTLAVQLRDRWRDSLAVFAVFSAALAMGETGLTLVSTPTTAPPASYSDNYYGPDPVLGYAPQPSVHARAVRRDSAGRTIFDVTYTIDEHGLRLTKSNPNGPTVAFFYSSPVLGEGVEDSETLPQQFADLTHDRYHVVNLGFPGYGPQVMLRMFETGVRDAVLAPKPVVFVAETAALQAEWVACRPGFTWRSPRYALVDGHAVFQGPCTTPFEVWALHALDHSEFYRMARSSLVNRQRDLDLYVGVFSDAIRLAESKYRVPFIVLYERSHIEEFAGTAYSDDTVMAALKNAGAIVIDHKLDEQPESGMFIPDDGHPTPKANRLLASLVRDEIAKLKAADPDRF